MPYHQYRCPDCGEEFELMMSYDREDAQPEKRCPRCDSARVAEVVLPIVLVSASTNHIQQPRR